MAAKRKRIGITLSEEAYNLLKRHTADVNKAVDNDGGTPESVSETWMAQHMIAEDLSNIFDVPLQDLLIKAHGGKRPGAGRKSQ